jgi:hypothetical protein
MAFDVVEFLANLIVESSRSPDECLAPATADRDPAPADLPPDWHLLWDERAAIMEYDGGLSRERAEAEALKDIMGMMRGQGITLPWRK